ncbi:HYD1 signature containing ADP-ribosyltransferase family protein [Streptomyces sp. NPDC091377]|uniref:HYD1 signature containing ADP-ribosyltransferase family protein n=1 Tax=Streptomyces sp. NPDC091377 TaxID=3365995 RepID=UPI0038058679
MARSAWFRSQARRLRSGTVTALGVALTVGLLPAFAPEAAAEETGKDRPGVQEDLGKPVEGRTFPSEKRPASPEIKGKVTTPAKVTWPAPGTDTLTLRNTSAQVGKLPVEVGPPKRLSKARPAAERVSVEVLDRKRTRAAGVDGVLMTVRHAADVASGTATRLELDYSGFASAYGGEYGSRLRLVTYPECFLTDPGKAACAKPRHLRSDNRTATDTLTADVPLAADSGVTVLAATAATGGDQGEFGATPLAPSAEWSVSNSSGAFNWNYPLRTPPVPGGLSPSITFGYNSQSVDGQTAATNNQGSWAGLGFSYEPGYIERRYKACSDDGHAETNGDLCWAYDNATIQLPGGPAGQLIKDDTSGEWRVAADSNTKIEKLTGAENGDNNGEHWKVTTTDGTQYFFGLDKLPGHATGKELTNSTWRVPVYGDDAGEPCYQATLANAHCLQAWRWNLDYVIDPNGSVMASFYTKEINYYTQGLKTTENGKAYARGGYLKRIEYGLREGKVFSTPASARVVFDTAERCLGAAADCEPADLTDTTATRWPDVPWDQNCKVDTKCVGQNSPTFWTRKKLTQVTTQIRSGSGYSDVDSWTLGHTFTDNGDSSRSLWLGTIKHTGHVGSTAVAMPSVQLENTQLPNRIDKPGDNIQAMNRSRLSGVRNETGGDLDIIYHAAECKAAALPSPDSPTTACYPVKWNPPGVQDPITDWFHKYLVARVVEGDHTTDAPDMTTAYEYLGDAGWKMARADGITEAKYRTRSDWRGYGKVRVTKSDGTTAADHRRTEHTYLRGLGGQVTVSTGATYTDSDHLSGLQVESATFDGAFATDKLVSKSTTDYWVKNTASRAHSWATDRAYYIRPQTTRTFTTRSSGAARETVSTHRYDSLGRVSETDDYGETDVADNTCTRNTYAANSSTHMLEMIARVETVAVGCATTPDRKTQVISDDLTFYDGKGLAEAPTRGLTTKVQRLASHNGTTATYETVTSSAIGDFDAYGRPLKVTDAAGTATTIQYTETDGLTSKKVETNVLGWESTTEYARAWGAMAAQIDMNGKRTDLAHDALGRLTDVWMPDRSKSLNALPSLKYSYHFPTNAPVAVRTQRLEKGGLTYGSEYQIYDGLLRPRQKQTEGPDGGRMIADTIYDGHGDLVQTNIDYYTTAAPAATLFQATGEIDGQVFTTHDGAGRKTADITKSAGDEKWRVSFAYDGDRVHADPPTGGIPSTTLTDARGRTTEIRRYKGAAPAPTGPATGYESTRYTYLPGGQLETVKDPAGNVWTYEYDQRGRKKAAVDPDTGRSTYAYDVLDRQTSSTDARGKKLSTVYDQIGRPVSTWEGDPTTGTRLTQSTYDHLAKGQPYGTYSYSGGQVQSSTVVTMIDEMYQPLVTKVTLAGSEAAELKGTYEFGTQYNDDGTVQSMRMPAAGGLPSETIGFSYDDVQRPTSMTSPLGSYVATATYTSTSLLQGLTLGAMTAQSKKTFLGYEYERGTDRLTNSQVRVEGTTPVHDANYTYDPAGNITSIADTPTGTTDVQCFTHDWERRLKSAWTSSNTPNRAAGTGAADAACAAAPTGSNVGGTTPYWQEFTYDASDNRETQVLKGLGGRPDTTRSYTYGKDASGDGGPHTLLKVDETTPAHGSTPAVNSQDTYGYDAAGNTEQRVVDGTTHDLNWSATGRLSGHTKAGQTSTFSYDSGGSRILRKEPGKQTLYLPGMELSLDTTTRAVTGTRYYSFAGKTVAVRTPQGVKALGGDHQGTMSVAVDPATGAVSKRRMDPFGNERGTATGPWPDDKGFLNKPVDASTGLTHIGAREYEPENGRFISADPLIDFTDAQQINGYAYANNTPITASDPTGEMLADPVGSGLGFGRADQITRYYAERPNLYAYYQSYSPKKATAEAHAAIAEAEASAAKQRAIAAAKEIAAIMADELGITDALDCFTTGNFGACGSTAFNIVTSAVGGAIAKLAVKYVNPLKWDKGKALVKQLAGLSDDLLGGLLKWSSASKRADDLADKAADIPDGRKGRDVDDPGCAVSNSFTPDTRVLMADGTTKRIRDVKAGDVVKATDPETGKTYDRKVTAEIKGKGAKQLVKITLDTDGASGTKTASATATDGHPFWVPALRDWIDATDLKPGQWLQTSAGTRVQVTALKRWTAPNQTVHNLTVADTHTYYVLAGATPVLVHNCNDEIPDVLHHYTNEAGHDGILASQELRPSTQAANPNDAKFGDGQYLTDVQPGTKRPGQLSAAFYRVPWLGRKVSHYISIDVRGLDVRKGREGVFYILNSEPLDLAGRIVGSGRN